MTASLNQQLTPVVVRRSTQRRWVFRILAITCASIVAVLLAEITLRLFVPDTRSPYIYDEFIGTRLEPGHKFVFQSEGHSSNVIDSRQLESDHRRPFAELNDGKLQLRVRPTRVSPMLMKQASTARSLHRRRLMPGEKHGRSGIESWKRCRQNPERWADRP